MLKKDKLRVSLLSYTTDPEQNVVAAIRQCYSPVGAKEIKKKTDKKLLVIYIFVYLCGRFNSVT